MRWRVLDGGGEAVEHRAGQPDVRGAHEPESQVLRAASDRLVHKVVCDTYLIYMVYKVYLRVQVKFSISCYGHSNESAHRLQ